MNLFWYGTGRRLWSVNAKYSSWNLSLQVACFALVWTLNRSWSPSWTCSTSRGQGVVPLLSLGHGSWPQHWLQVYKSKQTRGRYKLMTKNWCEGLSQPTDEVLYIYTHNFFAPYIQKRKVIRHPNPIPLEKKRCYMNRDVFADTDSDLDAQM